LSTSALFAARFAATDYLVWKAIFHLETAGKLLISLEDILSLFSKYSLKSLNNQTDFDSAIRRFDPSRPSQSQRSEFVKKMTFIDPEFPAHLEIQFAPHLEILCWFRFGQRPMEDIAR
jgi:hypothetical protein